MTINEVIQKIRLEQNYTDMVLDQLESGVIHNRCNKQTIKDERIKQLCFEYKKDNLEKYLNDLIFLLNF